jgi:uncharacterized protein (DUF433 family)
MVWMAAGARAGRRGGAKHGVAMEVSPRITVEADKCDGEPCIRGHRLTEEHVLARLAEGAEELLKEWDFLEAEDLRAALRFAQAG